VSDDGLDRWISDLRARVARGDLARLPPFDLGYRTGHLPGETTVRIMLADLDHLDGLSRASRDWLDAPWRRDELLRDFRRLRDLIG
jgi:hypothetical protein